jgi:hypothetical protein
LKNKIANVAFVLALSLGISAWPALPARSRAPEQQDTPAQTHTGKGEITSVSDGYVTIEIQVEYLPTPMAVIFTVNSDTKVEGKLAVGATATVEYHVDSQGKIIATHIVVQPSA